MARASTAGNGAERRLLARARRKTSELVAREILRDITSRRLPHGSRLPPEAEMLEQYGVSRASLREALRILEVHGVIAIKAGPKGGPIVIEGGAADFGEMATLYFQVNRVTFAELADARLTLEPMIARMAAERRSAADAERLVAFMSATSAGDGRRQEDYVDESLSFHDMLAGMAGNPVVSLIVSSFREIFMRYGRTSLDHEEHTAIIKIHNRIARAVIDGDGPAAEAAMRRHMQLFVEDFRRREPTLADEVVHWL